MIESRYRTLTVNSGKFKLGFLYSMGSNPSKNLVRLSSALVLAGVIVFIISFLTPTLLFLDTTSTGGDTASHTFAAWHLKNNLLPSGRVTGWTMANLGGFPLLENYFFLPFLLMAVFSYVIPINIAFKLVTTLGILGLPWAIFFFFRKLKQPFPVPQVAAVLSLPYLFMEGQSIWGGNIASSLSGTFCYSLGLCFTLVFLGLLYDLSTKKTHRAFPQTMLCSIILALTGFCHGYTLLFSGFASLFFLFLPGQFKANLKTLIIVHGTAIGLMAFWLFPLLTHLPWTTPFGFVWNFHDAGRFFDQMFPMVVRPVVLLSLLGLLAWLISTVKRRKCGLQDSDTAIFFLVYLVFTGLCLYTVGASLKLVDVRFLPFFQLFTVISGAMLFSRFSADKRTTPFVLLCFMFAVMLWVDSRETHIRNWSSHNNKGFENTPPWNDVQAIMNHLRGTENDPRIAYENSSIYESAGTLRTMESLPLFSGRSTLEGVYIQASILSPAIYCLQAEISRYPSMPLVEYDYPSFDLDVAAKHLRLFNVSHLILAEPESRKAAWNNSSYIPIFKQGPFEVFAVKGNNSTYVEPLKYRPVLISGPDFRKPFHSWFKSGNNDVFLIYDKQPGPKEKTLFLSASATESLEPVKNHIKSRITQNEILVEQATPGHPLLIKVSYHPNWKADGADKIYLASPGFMLIYPTSTKVRLYYDSTFVDHLGQWVSLATLFILIVSAMVRYFITPRPGKEITHA